MTDDKDANLHFQAFDASPGEKYRKWRQNLFSYAATKTDESGSSLADTLRGIDMGGPGAGAPAIPPGAPGLKMARLRDARAKAAYALIYKHISDGDLRTILFTNHFQNGFATIQFLDLAYDTPITRSELREMDKLWTELSIAQDVGIQQDSVSRFAKLLQRVNAERPAGQRHGFTELTEKLLEAIADASRHFNEGAMREYDAPAGARQFEYPAGHPAFPGQRNFGACVHYYDGQWKQAVKSRILTVTAPLRRTGGQPARAATDVANRAQRSNSSEHRAPSPTHTLQALAATGLDVTSDTATTTDFHALAAIELANAVGDGGDPEDFALEQCYDADNVPSVEIICDNCRGVGHPRRLCPSPRKYRTFDFAISLLQSAKHRAETRAQQDGRPRGGRRPPPRGQRAPFRPKSVPTQPRNFTTQTHRGHQAADSSLGGEESSLVDREVPLLDNAHHAQPTTFADDEYFDSALFQQEGDSVGEEAHMAVVEPTTPVYRRLVMFLVMLVHSIVHSISLRTALIVGSVAVVVSAVAAPVPTEHLGMLVGQAHLPGVVACVDSGATVTCLAESLAFSGDVDFTVTRADPRRKLRVASDQTLDIVAVGELRFSNVSGYRVVESERVTGTADVVFHEVAVVRGLSRTTILLSVQSMKKNDGIRVYFNSDNADGVDDCIKLACGLYVPFVHRTHDLAVPRAAVGRPAANLLRDTPWDIGLRIHAALCHPGATRVQYSNITYSGRSLPPMPMPHVCVGCRLGGSKAAPSATGRKRDGSYRPPRDKLSYYGQLVYSDCCVGFPPSFPHGFTGMVNFCDGYSGDRDRRFLTRVNSTQVHGALSDYCRVNRSKLRDGKIGCWQTDNGQEFRGECLTDAVDDLIEHHDFTVPNNRNANAVAERDWGVIERGVRACLAYADAPACLWPWAAQQCSQVYHFLATTVHNPPRSAHEFLHPGSSAVDMTWARVLFCDVTVALPERDVHGKLWHRAADGCHLGYDAKRRAHVVYCPRYRRLGTFTVTDWCGERSFTICKLISADTPVEYHQVDDLPMAPATATLLPTHFRAGRETGALAGSECEQATIKRSLGDRVDDLAWLAGAIDSSVMAASPSTIGCDVEHSSASRDSSVAPPALPTTVEEARRSPYWPLVKEALESEIKGKFIDNQAWDVVPRTAGMHVIRSKWVLKWGLNPDGTVKSVKARLVACGYGQIKGREFTDVYARTLAAPSFRLFCCIVALENLETDHIDAYKAFTQSYVDCDIYVEMPFGFARAGYVLKLRKALEGIRQGAHLWMEHNKAALLELGFRQSLVEASLYVHTRLDIVVAVFADDIAAAYPAAAISEYTAIKAEYARKIRVRTEAITPLAVFTGVVIDRNRDLGTLTIHQKPYLDQLAERYKGKFTPRNTPGPTAHAARREFDKMLVGQPSDKDLVDRVAYLKLIGALVWPASMTRPDIAYYVSFLASFNHCPRQVHYDAALNVLGYLVQTRDLGITYGGPLKVPLGLKEMPQGFVESGGLHTYHDSSWGTSAKPYGGFVVMRGNGVILASSRALKIVPDSTAEAETAVASKAAKETTAVRAICEDLGRVVKGPTVLLGDNKASYDIIVKTGLTARTRYFERATLLVKRLYMLLAITPYLISTNEMVADVLTKCADKVLFYKMRAYMLNANPPAEGHVHARTIAGRLLAWA